MQAVNDHGPQNFEVDHLVNNAGFADWTGFLDADWHRRHEMMQLNGAFHA